MWRSPQRTHWWPGLFDYLLQWPALRPKYINLPCRICYALIKIIFLSSQRWWIRKLQLVRNAATSELHQWIRIVHFSCSSKNAVHSPECYSQEFFSSKTHCLPLSVCLCLFPLWSAGTGSSTLLHFDSHFFPRDYFSLSLLIPLLRLQRMRF